MPSVTILFPPYFCVFIISSWTHHDLNFSSIFITFIYVCLWGAGCERVHPLTLWCMCRGQKTAVRSSFLFLPCGTRDRTQIVRLEQQVPLVTEMFFPQPCLFIFNYLFHLLEKVSKQLAMLQREYLLGTS